jgi:hypothetical protein
VYKELGTRVNLTVGSHTYYNQWVGLFRLTVDGESYDGWCIDLEHGITSGQCFDATLTDALRKTPWCQIGYIMTNYSPSSGNEAAAIQLALWKCKYGKDYVKVSHSGIESMALAIYTDAQGECPRVIAGYSQLTLEPDGELVVSGGVACQKFTATVTDSGVTPLQGIQVQFEATNGSFSPPNGTLLTVPTDGNGEASVTLCWDASDEGSLTAHTEGYWPVIIHPTGSIQETIILQHRELTAEESIAWEQAVDARISISPLTDTNKVGENHDLTALVEVNDGTGWAPAVGVEVTFTKPAGVGSVAPATDITDVNGEAQTVLTSAVVGSSTVQASATVTVGGQTFNLVTDGTGGNSGPANKDWVDARISISPLTDTNKVGEDHDLTALVEVNDGTGWAPAVGVVVTFTKTAGVGSVAPATDITDVNGEAQTVLTTTVVGSSTVQASATVIVGGQTFNLVTDGTAGNSGPAEKDWTEPCGLRIIKKDWDTGDIVNRPGLIVKITPHPYTGTDYLEVEDNVSAYDKHTDGYGTILLLEIRCDLCYDIEEIRAPDGYNLDSEPVYDVCVSSIPDVFLYNTQSDGECETAFAYHGDYDGECFSYYGFSRWGWSIGPLSAGDYTFDIYAGAGQCDMSKGTLVGKLYVYYHGSTAWVTYTMTSDFTMDETHLYVGSEILPRDKNDEYTVAPGQYPFIHDPIDLKVDYYEITGLSGDIYVVAHAVVCGAYPD